MLSKILLAVAPAWAIQVPQGANPIALAQGDWTYTNSKSWGGSCHGKKQSPIDIKDKSAYSKNTAHVEQTGNLRMRDLMHYTPAEVSLTFENNGHCIRTTNTGQKGSVLVDNQEYQMFGFNFHFPSEHTIDGKKAAGEMHIMHAKNIKEPMSDKLLVTAVLIEEAADGEESPFFENIGFKDISGLTVGKTKTVEKAKVQIFKDLNSTVLGNFWHYEGSLTTPPCTENVEWFVMKKSVKIAKKTHDEFKALFPKGNARPIQLFNAAKVNSADRRIMVADTPFIVKPSGHQAEHVWKPKGSAAGVGILGALLALFFCY